jgi:hypothetical protein
MDECKTAAGPRPITGQSSPGTTREATIDQVNGGFCGVVIDTPGIWWWVNGTGSVIRASSCHENTRIKVKLSIFTGSCDALRCVTGGSNPDYECPLLVERGDDGAWGTRSTAIDFPTFKGQSYYILVQQESEAEPGTVWMNFQKPDFPQNDACVDAVGPVPRDETMIFGTSSGGALSNVDAGYCGAPSLYPGVWYQVFGTGGSVTVSACSEFNVDGFYFSVYNAANCDELSCTPGEYDINILDVEKCTFGPAAIRRPKTAYTFQTRDRDRYYIYVHYARTKVDKPTSDFRFFVDDGKKGKAGTGGITNIKFNKFSKTDGGNNGNGSGNNGKNSGAISTGCWMGLGFVSITVSLLF